MTNDLPVKAALYLITRKEQRKTSKLIQHWH